MLGPSSPVQTLRRVFQNAFTVHDIAVPLVSFDDTTSAEQVRSDMETNRFQVVGIRKNGRICGYVELDDLGKGMCGDHQRAFEASQVINDSASLGELIQQLRDHRRLFVSVLGQIGGIVSRSDLQKPPVRMWLFGMVTLIEMRITRLIRRFCPDDTWHPFLSDGRMEKAKALLVERTRRNQDLHLLDCLQLSDKLQIVSRNEYVRKQTRYESRRQMEQATKLIEKLRNNLTHSQDIVTNDWETIVRLSENLDNIVNGPPGLQNEPLES